MDGWMANDWNYLPSTEEIVEKEEETPWPFYRNDENLICYKEPKIDENGRQPKHDNSERHVHKWFLSRAQMIPVSAQACNQHSTPYRLFRFFNEDPTEYNFNLCKRHNWRANRILRGSAVAGLRPWPSTVLGTRILQDHTHSITTTNTRYTELIT